MASVSHASRGSQSLVVYCHVRFWQSRPVRRGHAVHRFAPSCSIRLRCVAPVLVMPVLARIVPLRSGQCLGVPVLLGLLRARSAEVRSVVRCQSCYRGSAQVGHLGSRSLALCQSGREGTGWLRLVRAVTPVMPFRETDGSGGFGVRAVVLWSVLVCQSSRDRSVGLAKSCRVMPVGSFLVMFW